MPLPLLLLLMAAAGDAATGTSAVYSPLYRDGDTTTATTGAALAGCPPPPSFDGTSCQSIGIAQSSCTIAACKARWSSTFAAQWHSENGVEACSCLGIDLCIIADLCRDKAPAPTPRQPTPPPAPTQPSCGGGCIVGTANYKCCCGCFNSTTCGRQGVVSNATCSTTSQSCSCASSSSSGSASFSWAPIGIGVAVVLLGCAGFFCRRSSAGPSAGGYAPVPAAPMRPQQQQQQQQQQQHIPAPQPPPIYE